MFRHMKNAIALRKRHILNPQRLSRLLALSLFVLPFFPSLIVSCLFLTLSLFV